MRHTPVSRRTILAAAAFASMLPLAGALADPPAAPFASDRISVATRVPAPTWS